ncbi:MAG: ATP-binding protein [Streptococcaceae bacterium]|jgi:predicted AAA+ superfamily ATPase|nr:ATP-binding protein [Streptococcaceae bacterium]
MFHRDLYFNQIKNFIGKDIIKVITGFRRSGKSVFLKQIMDSIDSNSKVYLNFEKKINEKYRDENELNSYLESQIKPNQKTYIFLDEIQLVEGFESVLSSLKASYDVDLYITGSNSRLLSGELATLLAGRYVSILMLPFSYKEFKQVRLDASFEDYIVEGGMPMVSDLELADRERRMILEDIFNSVILKDIIDRNKIRDVSVLEKLITYVISEVGHVFSANSISKYLKSQRQNVSINTVINYLKACQAAYLFNAVPFEDAKGKSIFNVNDKYYVIDQGMRDAIIGNNFESIELILENIVYYELLRRGFKVTVGRNGSKEIDFIARKSGKVEYYQVTYIMGAKETRDREFSAYDGIADNFPKFVLSTDRLDFSQNGIVHRNIEDWLLEDY